ncbi:metal ABC transporter ATP-binding protein [Pseudaestuariivita sp.]|uniref:metal ABC transporter ATP-binding protein n=1 Tax=Pseudaestuariivita sp. TaxID=2211669 RepID=UPI004059E703
MPVTHCEDRLIAAEGLGLRYGQHAVLRHVDLQVARGEIVTIVGPNGSGKSTLLKVLIGALEATEGRVRRARGLRLGYVPQKLMLDPTLPMTVARFLRLRAAGACDVPALLTSVGLGDVARQQVSELSGGQLQRVLLARALRDAPDLVILDEPTQGLDQPGAAEFYRRIETVRAQTGAGVLMVSHDLHVVMAASDRVICLNGHVCCEGAPAQVASAPEYRALFGSGTGGTLALYRHEHDHHHDHGHGGETPAT